jgi:hypothetical protein
MDKNKIATWVGFAGGGVFIILNIATNGQVPGGFKGGVAGFLLGYALGWLVLAFVPSRFFRDKRESKDSHDDSPGESEKSSIPPGKGGI